MEKKEAIKYIIDLLRYSKIILCYLCKINEDIKYNLDMAKLDLNRLRVDNNKKSELKKELREIIKEIKKSYKEFFDIEEEISEIIFELKKLK